MLGDGNHRPGAVERRCKTSRAGLELIGNAEGCRRDPYKCPADVWTDGIGNTHGVKPGVRKTDQQIAADWQKNILAAERCVTSYAAGDKLPQGAFDAAVSITFNAGCTTMQKSTMFRLFRQGKLWPPASSSHVGYMPAA